MRWGYLAPRLIIALTFWSLIHFGLDPALKRITRFSAEMVMDSKVDLKVLDTKFFPPRVKLKEVAVADSSNPGFNLIEFDALRMKLEGMPLLRRSYIIQSASLTGLQFGTARNDLGERESQIDFSLPTFKVDGFDISLDVNPGDWLGGLTETVKNSIDPEQLESVQLSRLKQQEWKKRFAEKEEKLDLLKKQYDQIRSQVKGVKGNAIDKLQAYHDAAMNAKHLRKEIKRLRNELSQLPKIAMSDYKQIDQARLRDQEKLKNQVQTLKMDPKSISKLLLGPELEEKVQQTVQYLSWLKENLSDKIDIPNPDRLRGIEINFAQEEPLPKYLCRNLYLSGNTVISGQEFEFKGILHDFTSDPKLHQKPMVVEVEGTGQDNFLAKATIDSTTDVPLYDLRFQYLQNTPPVIHLGEGSEIAIDLSSDQAILKSQLKIRNGEVAGNIELVQSACHFELIESKQTKQNSMMTQSLQSTLNEIDSLHTRLDLSGTLENPAWHVSSNLGDHLSRGLTNLFKDQFENQKSEMVKLVDQHAKKELKQFERLLNGEYSQIFAKLNLQEEDAQKIIQKVAGGGELKLDSLFR